jgi:PIN domain nuclease of toxin-antitoxin system
VTRYLLDTHIWLWLQLDPTRIAQPLLDELANESHEVMLSAASAWEIAVKYSLGKLGLPEPPDRFVPDRMRRSGVTGLAIEPSHALAMADLPPLHRDPFDRMLIVQAKALDLVLVTADPQITRYDVSLEFVKSPR